MSDWNRLSAIEMRGTTYGTGNKSGMSEGQVRRPIYLTAPVSISTTHTRYIYRSC